MIEKLTLEEFRKKLEELGVDSTEDILPLIDKSQIPDLPEGTEPHNWWIENFMAEHTKYAVVLMGDFVCEHYKGDEFISTTRTPIYYEQTRNPESSA